MGSDHFQGDGINLAGEYKGEVTGTDGLQGVNTCSLGAMHHEREGLPVAMVTQGYIEDDAAITSEVVEFGVG